MGEAAETCAYLAKGRKIAVTARLHQRTWEDGEQLRERIEVVADAYGDQFLDVPAGDDSTSVGGVAQEEHADDIPF